MALTQFAKDRLRFGLANIAAGSNYASVINAGTGTLYQASKDAFTHAAGNRPIARAINVKILANTALSDNDTWRLAVACGSYTAALAIKTEQAT